MSYFQISAFSHGKSNFKAVVAGKGTDSCRILGEILLEAAQFPKDIVYSFLIMDDSGDSIKEIFADDSFVEEGNSSFAVVDECSVDELASLAKGHTCLFVYDAISGDSFNLMISELKAPKANFSTKILSVEGEAPQFIAEAFDPLLLDSLEIEEDALEDFNEDINEEYEEEV